MKHVAALVTKIVLESDLKLWIERKCDDAGARVEWFSVTESTARYKEVFQSSANVITWQCRMPHWWTSKWGNNVLHVENSLLSQGTGCFVDSRGFFSESALCKEQHWQNSYDVDCDGFSERQFNSKAFQGGTNGGPVLLALQCRNDCNINFEFPAAPKGDRVEWLLTQLEQLAPGDTPLLIRPHPRERHLFETHPKRGQFEWSMDGDFPNVLKECSALVTVNSTAASEGCLLGIPVAVLGTGAFTGSGAVFECHENLGRLHDFMAARHRNEEAQRRYCQAVLGAHFLPYRHVGDVTCPEFDRWLGRLR